MSRREKRDEKKGISLVGFVVILIALVCVEGIYIVKLRGTDNLENKDEEVIAVKNTNENVAKEENKDEIKGEGNAETTNNFTNENSLNNKLISSLGYDVNTMLDNILLNVESQTEVGNIVSFVDGNATENTVNSQEINEKKDAYKVVIMNNFDNPEIITSIKLENGILKCEYNLKKLLNTIGLESKSYSELGANENNMAVYNFN